jgi:8-oxo-dGTP diphosphatase
MSKTPHTILGCGVCVIRKNKVLLAQRIAPDKPGYGLWAMPGGTIEAGETPHEAARREVEEETGLRARLVVDIEQWHWTDKWHPEHPWVTLYVGATVEDGDPVQTEPSKQGPWGWYEPTRLPQPLWDGVEGCLGSLGLL